MAHFMLKILCENSEQSVDLVEKARHGRKAQRKEIKIQQVCGAFYF
jgi:hypothetical protein